MQSQLLYVNSALRHSGEPYDFRLILGNGALVARRGFRTKIAISEATINRSWYNVREGANTLLLNSQPLDIPVGQYNALDLRVALSTALPAGWTVMYSRLTAKFTFTRPSDGVESYQIQTGPLGPLLGFPMNSTILLSTAAPSVTSFRPARVNSENSILVHADIAKAGGSVLDNLTQTDAFNDSTVLAKIPIDAPPNDNIVYRAQTDLDFVELTQGHADTLRIWLTDENDDILPLGFDWTMTLAVLHVPQDSTDTLETLQESRDLLKLLVLSKKSVLA